MNITKESELKLKLKSTDPTGLYENLNSYLGPIQQESGSKVLVFKNFLNDCLISLRGRLFQFQDKKYKDKESALNELFKAYDLCLRHYMELADYSEVKSQIRSILETIAAGLHSTNKKILQKSPPLLSYAQSNQKSSTIKGQSSAQSVSDRTASMAYLSSTTRGLTIACHAISNFILKCANQLETNEMDVPCMDMFSTIVDMCHVQSRLILADLSVIYEKIGDEDIQLVESACVAFSISIKANLKLQESTKVIKDIIIVSEWSTREELKFIIDWMNELANGLPKESRREQALNVLSLRCEVFWLFLESQPSHLSQCDLEDFSLDTYKKTGSLLNLLNDIDYQRMKERVIGILEIWSIKKDRIQNLPTPTHIVNTWVKCQFMRDDCFDSPILYDLLTPSITKSEKNTWILLEQEHKSYMEMSSKFTSAGQKVKSQKMKRKIRDAFMKNINTTTESYFQKAQTHLEKGKTVIDCGIDDTAIRTCLKDAITVMEDVISNREHLPSEVNLINHLLFVAYCLHDLCDSEVNPHLETTFGSAKPLYERIVILICNIFDLLQLKGFRYPSNDAYKLMIKVFNLMSLPLEKKLKLLWQSGRLNHPLCTSPLSLKFIRNLSNKSELEKFEFYIDCFEKEFLQHFSFLFANFHLNSNHRIACEVTSMDPIWSHTTFHVGDIYQTFIANGKLIEALSYAKKAQRRQYSELSKFVHNGQEQDKGYGTCFSINIWEMIKSLAGDVVSFHSSRSDLDKPYISPWKILQCYLESTLQIGIIYEMMGDGAEAVVHLELGNAISSSLNLHLFVVAFSSLLGKLYVQQRKISLAKAVLEVAMNLLKSKDTFGCLKCKLLLHASVIEHIGDLRPMEPTACECVVLQEPAKNLYELALMKLDVSTWKNSLSYSDDASLTSVECSCSKASEDEQKRKTKKARVVNKSREEKEVVLDQIGCKSYSTCLTKCVFSKMGCWQCLPSKVAKSGLLNDLINLKWEFVRRKMSMKLLSRSGRCFKNPNQTNEVHKSILRRISVLVGKNPFCYTFSSILPDHFRNLVAKETSNDVFAIERAEILYDICWYWIKCNHSNSMRNVFSNPESIKLEEIASWLILAFVLSRDVPIVFQEVSKLLAVMYLVSTFSDNFSFSPYSKGLSELAWVFYFHQASIGAHISCQFLSNLSNKYKSQNISGSSDSGESLFDLLRPPKTRKELQKHVAKFMVGLPSTTIVCITLLGHEYTSLLEKLLSPPISPKAWMLVSRKSVKGEPVVMLFPLDTILKSTCSNYKKTVKVPSSKWCDTIVDHIAPSFKTIMDHYYFMLKDTLSTKKKSQLLIGRANSFEDDLKTLLRNIEDLWLDSWKCSLLGEMVNCENFDKVLNNLLKELKCKPKQDINEDLLKIILGGKTWISSLTSNKGCYIGNLGYCKKLPNDILSKPTNVSHEQLFGFIEALDSLKLEINCSAKRGPIMLVLDYEVQMLPWESLPILKNQEVYRMPSITSIYVVLDKCNIEGQIGTNSVSFPSIDPHHAFYVLNPDGSLKVYQKTFEKNFRDMKFEGKVGSEPSVNDLVAALKSHDIYLYFGHSSGDRYIPNNVVKKLEKCCAALLMGCASGALILQGRYAPIGAPLSYLMAGSPIVVANLWTMLEKEVSLFAEIFFMNTLNPLEDPHDFHDRERIGAFVADAREKCDRPFMSGASIVCYGLPVGIRRREEIEN